MNNFTSLCSEYLPYSDEESINDEISSKVDNPEGNKENLSSGNFTSSSPVSTLHDNNEPRRIFETLPAASQDHASNSETEKVRNTRPGILRDLLEKDTDCRAIVLKYDANNSLTKPLRNRLARFIIKYEKEKYFKNLSSGELLSDFYISTSKFEFYANQIHQTFPREASSTYYTPFRRENNVTVNAAGKLWWHYDYSKGKMFKDGILKSRGKKSNTPVNDGAISASSTNKLKLLCTILSPWVDVIQLWVATFDARRTNLIHNHLSVKSYLDNFACLRTSKALSLFESDFSNLYPNAVGRLQSTWDFATDHLTEVINALPIKDQNDLILRGQLTSDNSNLRTGILLSLLPYLIPPRRPGRKRKNEEIGNDESQLPRTLSFAERKEAFFLHISSVVDLETVLSTGIDQTSRLALQHQPIPIIVGPFENIAACYIILENTLYQSDSILHAFESTIQICYAVNCEYPLNARSLWIFLQQAFLKIEEVTDKPSNDVVALIGAIRTIVEEVEKNST